MTTIDIQDAALTALLKLAETRSWSRVTLAQIAETSGHTLTDFHGILDKETLTASLDPMFDRAMSEGSLDPEDTPRTRLFDVLMFRFEAMEAHRDGVMSYLRWRDSTLTGLRLRLENRLATARWALACSGLDGASPVPKNVQEIAIAWVIAQAERAWREETSADMTRTMARLDAELLKLESRIRWVRGVRSVQKDENA